MNILIVKLSAIGDVVHTLPALCALRRHYPRARITYLVEEAAADLVRGHAALDRVLVSRRKQWLRGLRTSRRRYHLRQIRRFVHDLRDTRYDLVFDFQAALKGAMLIALTRGRRKIGFDRGMVHSEHSHLFLNERIPPVSMEIHALRRYLMLVEAVGVPEGPVEYRIPVREADRREVRRLLSQQGCGDRRALVAINPVAQWPTKLWGEHAFAAAADALQDALGVDIVFTGGRGDRDTVARIRRDMNARSADLAGRTRLTTLAALYERADAVISTDTGPMHLAAAVGTPVVALFGPTAPWRTGPYGDGHAVVRTGIHCSPCFRRSCPLPVRVCMADIRPEDVVAAVRSLQPFAAGSTVEGRV